MDATTGASANFPPITTTQSNLTGAERVKDLQFQSQVDRFKSFGTDSDAKKAPLTGEARERELKRLRDASDQLEGIFLNMMFKTMRSTLNKENVLNGGMAEDVFEDMLYDEYTVGAAKSNSLGISDMIFNQMKAHV